jgi:hypothetical protein
MGEVQTMTDKRSDWDAVHPLNPEDVESGGIPDGVEDKAWPPRNLETKRL